MEHDGAITDDNQETVDFLMETHFRGCQDDVDSHTTPTATHMEEIISSIVCEETTKWAVKTFQHFKLAGTDDIALILLYKVQMLTI